MKFNRDRKDTYFFNFIVKLTKILYRDFKIYNQFYGKYYKQ